MEFKRLNNMTGKDPVMNRRIASIFLNDFEAFKELFLSGTEQKQLDQIQFALHKIKPRLVIFEMDDLVNQYEELLQIANSEVPSLEYEEKLIAVIKETEIKIAKVREFLISL